MSKELAITLLSTPEDFRSWLTTSEIEEYSSQNALEMYLEKQTKLVFQVKLTNILVVEEGKEQVRVYDLYAMPGWITYFVLEFVTSIDNDGSISLADCIQVLDDFILESELDFHVQ